MDALGNVSGMQTSLARAALASAAGGSTPATRSMVGGAQASWGGWARAKSKGGKFGKPVGVGLGLGLGVRPFWVVQTFASQRRVRSKAGPGGMGREPLHTTNLSTEVEGRVTDADELVTQQASVDLGTVSDGSRRVLEFVAAWDLLAEHLRPVGLASGQPAEVILLALKLVLPKLQEMGAEAQRRALAVATLLADLGMDADTVAVGLLDGAVGEGALSLAEAAPVMGMPILQLLHDTKRVREIPARLDVHDDDSADALRRFCLAFHDVRAVVVELATRLDSLRNIEGYRPYQRSILALETMQLYAPMAHALRVEGVREELEDRAFEVLFPSTYNTLSSWIRSRSDAHEEVLMRSVVHLTQLLGRDEEVVRLAGEKAVTVSARRKSLYSTMRKLISDNRPKEQVHDLLGLRIIITPQPGSPAFGEDDDAAQAAVAACYRAQDLAHSHWEPTPGRTKDYLANPKANGYRSLHSTCTPRSSDDLDQMALELGIDRKELENTQLELQIRTAAMNARAEYGAASHAAYKSGMSDPGSVANLQALLESAEQEAAERYTMLSGDRLNLLPEGTEEGEIMDMQNQAAGGSDRLWSQFDKNMDGYINVDELKQVMQELGVIGDNCIEVDEFMAMVDLDNNGLISEEEFQKLRSRLSLLMQLPKQDAATWEQLQLRLGAPEDSSPPDPTNEQSPPGNSARPTHAPSGDRLLDQSDSAPRSELVMRLRREPPEGNLETARKEDAPVGGHKPGEEGAASEGKQQVGDGGGQEPLHHRGMSERERVRSASMAATSSLEPKPLEYGRKAKSFAAAGSRHDQPGSSGSREAWDEVAQQRVMELTKKGAKLVATGEHQEARQVVEKCAALVASGLQHPPALTLLWARLARAEGSHAVAREQFREAVSEFSTQQGAGTKGHIVALLAWVDMEKKQGNVFAVRGLLEEANHAIAQLHQHSTVEERPKAMIGLMHSWALAEKRCNNIQKARELLIQAEEMDPSNAYVLQARAVLESTHGSLETARKYFSKGLEMHPEDSKLWQASATCEAKHGNIEMARENFQKGLKVDPENCFLLQAWGVAEAKAKQFGRARELFERAVGINDKNVACWQAWGHMEEKAGSTARAAQLLERGLKANPTNVHCLQACARLARLQKDFTYSRVLLRQALSIDPENAPVLQEWGRLEQQAENHDVAKELFKRARNLDRKKKYAFMGNQPGFQQ